MKVPSTYSILIFFCGAVLILLSSDLKGTNPSSSNQASPEIVARGKRIFDNACASCHGKEGRGDGPVSANLKLRPWNLQRGVYHNRSTFAGKYPTDYDLYLTLSRGLHNTTMPFFRQMDMNDRWAVVQFIKTLSPKFSDSNWYSPPDTMSYAGYIPSTQKSLSEGRKIYIKECSRCHEKTEKSSVMPTMFDDNGEPRELIDLTDPAVYKYSESAIDIFRIASTSLASKMMRTEDLWNVSNYTWSLQSFNQFRDAREK